MKKTTTEIKNQDYSEFLKGLKDKSVLLDVSYQKSILKFVKKD